MRFGVVPEVNMNSGVFLCEFLITYIRYRYTSFFWSRSDVAMFFNTSGNRADTSLPRVMDMIVF
jgi:hypothetical protein